ncbi:hypothetical protein CEXT_426301 [Caerostris extrusa]|uniref:Uncharacterized protein n=1 Tax=Caerostris extrusa TaxID=172846 RepID=A0AAV4SVN0_CAEEX|nr:hypothetical protein CEXT_426301 [Caerostris extrusa]
MHILWYVDFRISLGWLKVMYSLNFRKRKNVLTTMLCMHWNSTFEKQTLLAKQGNNSLASNGIFPGNFLPTLSSPGSDLFLKMRCRWQSNIKRIFFRGETQRLIWMLKRVGRERVRKSNALPCLQLWNLKTF